VWTKSEKMGLAWRRYDRLEWIVGGNEQRMYGMNTMRRSHELELRPKRHYPTYATSTGTQRIEEPPGIEGFMILLTSQRGKQKRWGKLFSKKLYFYTADQYLCFCRPAKARPPAPPHLANICTSQVPQVSEIRDEAPLLYEVEPFRVEQSEGGAEGQIAWLTAGRKVYARRHDAEAYAEARRTVHNLDQAEGYINLCRVTKARSPEAAEGDEETCPNPGDVEFLGEARQANNEAGDGSREQPTRHSKGNRTLELVLDHGLVIRLRTYNQQTCEEWIKRLNEMATYWKARTRDDIRRMKTVRRRNLERLEIDEEQESMLGQFAQKWEVFKAEASPELFHTCGLAGCRAVKVCRGPKSPREIPIANTATIDVW
jgi:hypothetical protein